MNKAYFILCEGVAVGYLTAATGEEAHRLGYQCVQKLHPDLQGETARDLKPRVQALRCPELDGDDIWGESIESFFHLFSGGKPRHLNKMSDEDVVELGRSKRVCEPVIAWFMNRLACGGLVKTHNENGRWHLYYYASPRDAVEDN